MRLTLIFLASLISFLSHAQLRTYHLPVQSSTKNLRTASHDSAQVSLPFWDDFSTSRGTPDTALWLHSEDVSIHSGTGINPPSINVAVFDGADASGRPYSNIGTATGEGDVLTSRFIDLSEADPASTHLSFYFQREGLGELPDQEDSLSLFIKGSDSVWQNVFNVSGTDDLNSSEFTFVSIPIADPKYFFGYFQFKFVSYGRLSGPYDTWNVDYIYLNDGRKGTINELNDRTITRAPSSIFKKFTSIPYHQFVAYVDMGESFTDSISTEVINIEPENLVQPININVWIADQQSGERLLTLDADRNVPPSLPGMQRRTFWSSALNPQDLITLGDSLYLTTVFSIIGGDTTIPVNLKVNDTARTNFSIHQDLAYDDGTAEYGAGMNIARAQVAYRFFTPVEDQITGIKIYFPAFGGQSSRSFVMKVWDHLDDDSGLKYSQESVVQNPPSLNEFVYYRFLRPVTVSDTFYVGYEQNVNDFFVVGLDKNTDSGDDIFFNPDVQWQQNTNLRGSLMMRPVFGNTEDIVTGLDPGEESLKVYPNPSHGIFTYEGRECYFQVYNILGVLLQEGNFRRKDQLNLTGQKSGIYLLKLRTENQEKSFRLIVN